MPTVRRRFRVLIMVAATTAAAVATAQTAVQLRYRTPTGEQRTCMYTTDASGVSLDGRTGNLMATGTFSGDCPSTDTPPTPADPTFINRLEGDIPSAITTGSAQTLTWAADADSCGYDGGAFPAGVTFANWPTTGLACNSAASCATLHSVPVTPPADGTYTFRLRCSRTGATSTVVSEVQTTASSAPDTGGCIAPASLTRVLVGSVKDVGETTGHNEDVTKFENLFGGMHDQPHKAWPGQRNLLRRPLLPRNFYYSLKFTVPETMNQTAWGKYRFEETQPESAMSMTISTRCGDFRQSAENPIAPSCVLSDANTGTNNSLWWRLPTSAVSPAVGCPLVPGQTYYLNIILASLADPTTPYCAVACTNHMQNEGSTNWP